jgi:RNA polymerase II subunit A C-terminal domain phosphatase SSU72
VQSFGSGNSVKLPGPSVDKPNIYDFDTTSYEEIYQDLKNKDLKLLSSSLI